MKLWLQDSDIEIYSIQNENKSLTERFIITFMITRLIAGYHYIKMSYYPEPET